MGSGPAPSEATIERIAARDGGSVAIKRRLAPGGHPVVFLHGLAVNADLWDLPPVEGPGFRFHSLASQLHERGFDVWLMNLRGHGAPHMLSEPPPGQTDWCVDHFIVHEVPAVLDHVVQVTGRRPLVIGASMGAMTLAGYLQGARLAGPPSPPAIIADPEVARQRQAALAGAVLAEFPAALRWPDSLYDEQGKVRWDALLRDWHRNDGDVNYPFEIMSRVGWLHALLAAVGEVPLTAFRGDPQAGPWYAGLPRAIAEGIEHVERVAMQAMLRAAGTFTGATNHRAEVMLHGRRCVLDDMKAGVLRQMAKCVRRGAFVSDVGAPDHVYSDHYELVELPLLVVQGGRDRIANAGVTRSAFFDVVRSTDKQFLFDEEIAHGEIEAAPAACERLYPAIIAWIAAHAAT